MKRLLISQTKAMKSVAYDFKTLSIKKMLLFDGKYDLVYDFLPLGFHFTNNKIPFEYKPPRIQAPKI